MRHPDPPIQMRRYLAVAKRAGVEFDTAWRWADQRTVYPGTREHRDQYKAVIAETRGAFEAAYNDEEVPGGEACLRLAQTFWHEGNFTTSGTTVRHYYVPAEERREPTPRSPSALCSTTRSDAASVRSTAPEMP